MHIRLLEKVSPIYLWPWLVTRDGHGPGWHDGPAGPGWHFKTLGPNGPKTGRNAFKDENKLNKKKQNFVKFIQKYTFSLK